MSDMLIKIVYFCHHAPSAVVDAICKGTSALTFLSPKNIFQMMIIFAIKMLDYRTYNVDHLSIPDFCCFHSLFPAFTSLSFD